VGATLGRYHVVSRLVTGTVSELWVATRPTRVGSDPRVVLKTLLPDRDDMRELARNFESEAAIGLKLNHPNLVRTLDYSWLNEPRYIAFEYIDGLSLRDIRERLRAGERVPQRLLLSMIVDVCHGLHAAHELADDHGPLEFVHRDIRPEHILITATGATKLIDFGAAVIHRPAPYPRFAGKFCYVAPERLDGRPEDRRSDIYALGALMYELLTGTRAFGEDGLSTVGRILDAVPRPPNQLVRDVPEELSRITCKAMAYRPGDRYPTAAALAADLEALLAGFEIGPSEEDCRRIVMRMLAEGAALPLGGARPGEAPVEVVRRTREMDLPAQPRAPAGRHGTPPVEALSVPIPLAELGLPALPPGFAVPVTPAPVPVLKEFVPLVPEPAPDNYAWVDQEWADHGLFGEEAPASDAPAAAPPRATPVNDSAPVAPLAPPALLFEGRSVAPAMVASPRAVPTVPSPAAIFVEPSRRHPATWFEVGARTPVAQPRPAPAAPVRTERPRSATEAVRAFDRGLGLLQDKLYAAALDEWERAVALEPDNRTYQVNLRRLRERLAARDQGE
jgi:serine/threonine-protein kinase